MAQYMAVIQGNRGEASRLGSKDSGIHARAQGWHVGVRVWGSLREREGQKEDVFDVWATSGSTGGASDQYIAEVYRNAAGEYVIRSKEGDRLALITEVADKLYDESGTDPLPSHTPYLFAAIARGERGAAVELNLDDEKDAQFHKLLVEAFGPCDTSETCHDVWGYICTTLEGE